MLREPNPAEHLREQLRRASASLDLAELTGQPFAMSQALAEVARCHRELRARASAEMHFECAVRWARLSGSTDHLADLLCEAADAAVAVAQAADREAATPSGATPGVDASADPGADTGAHHCAAHAARERARDHVFEVSQLVGRISDPSCEARLLLRGCELLERCGDRADALQMQRRALDRLGGVAPRDASRLSGFGRLADG
jgi:hypothetical protein